MRRVAVIAALAAACGGGGDAPSCEEVMKTVNARLGVEDPDPPTQCIEEKWSPALRRCLVGIKSEEDGIACFAKHQGEAARKDKPNEAEAQLDRIGKAIKAYVVESGGLPASSAERTPATPCCESPRSDKKCEPDPTLWLAPPWSDLGFSIDEPHYFQYELEAGDGSVMVRAIGDLDCDTTEMVYELEATLDGGRVSTTLTKPARSD